jgi:Ankyrin repeats (3 copies)
MPFCRPLDLGFLLEVRGRLRQILSCQGPWNVDLRTPPGQECSNGSLLCIRRGHPGILNFRFLICDSRFKNMLRVACQAAIGVMTFESVIEHFGTHHLRVSNVQRYLDAGGDVNRRDPRMAWTLLHFAAEDCDQDIIRLLVAHGADLRAADQNGWTPLHIATDSDLDTSTRGGRRPTDLPTARLLVELGADQVMRSVDGLTARDIARDYGDEALYDSVLRSRAA